MGRRKKGGRRENEGQVEREGEAWGGAEEAVTGYTQGRFGDALKARVPQSPIC